MTKHIALSFDNVSDDGPALPDKIIDARDSRRNGHVNDEPVEEIELGSRDEILRELGKIAHDVHLTPASYYAVLTDWRDSGRIVDLDETRPWSPADLKVLAAEASQWKAAPVIAPLKVTRVKKKLERVKPVTHGGEDVRRSTHPPRQFAVDEIMPTGFGIIAGAPKVGKSWMSLQTCLAVSTGSDLLGRRAVPRAVLYYALEDSASRLTTRIHQLLSETASKIREDISIDQLSIRYEAPRLGGGLEEDVDDWLKEHPGGVVIIDVLAMVRPTKAHSGSAYDEDYSVLSPLQGVSKRNKMSTVAIVTHTRKAGGEDPLTTFQGTMGVIGSADWTWLIRRPDRLTGTGTLLVVGRDVEDQLLGITLEKDGYWKLDTEASVPLGSPQWNATYDYVEEHGPCFAKVISEGLDENRTTVQMRLNKMVEANVLLKTEHGYLTPALPVNRSRESTKSTESIESTESTESHESTESRESRQMTHATKTRQKVGIHRESASHAGAPAGDPRDSHDSVDSDDSPPRHEAVDDSEIETTESTESRRNGGTPPGRPRPRAPLTRVPARRTLDDDEGPI